MIEILKKPVVLATVAAVSFLVLLLILEQAFSTSNWENPPERFGTRDFVAFWSGTQLFLKGKDPYQSVNMLEVEQQVMPHMTEAQVFLNPPWTLPVYSVFFWPSFNIARAVWIGLNFVFLFGIIIWCSRIFNVKADGTLIIVGMTFLPALMTIWMGQATLMVIFCAVAGYGMYLEKKVFRSALISIPVICKPHLVFIFFLCWCLDLLRKRDLRWYATFVTGSLALCGLALAIIPEIFFYWRQADFSPLVFRTSTLGTRIRDLILIVTGEVAVWPVWFVPAAGVLLTLCCIRIKDSAAFLALLLALSVGFAPYAWFYDYVALLPLQLLLTVKVRQNFRGRKRRLALLFVISPQLIVLLFAQLSSDLGGYYWFPWLFVICYLVATRYLFPAEAARVEATDG